MLKPHIKTALLQLSCIFSCLIAGANKEITLPGNVGIGTSSPAKTLHVDGEVQIDGAAQVNGDITVNGKLYAEAGGDIPMGPYTQVD